MKLLKKIKDAFKKEKFNPKEDEINIKISGPWSAAVKPDPIPVPQDPTRKDK